MLTNRKREREMEVKLLEAAREMEVKLLEAAIAGDPDMLNGVITGGAEDLDILNRVFTGGAAEETPLHIAAQLGHSEFVAMIGILKPEFAHAKNSEGRCPLHLASAKEHVETVAELLKINSGVCFVRDRDGRTPFHIAAMKGRIQVLEKLAEEKIKAAWVWADCGQPILHLCANHNQFDALKLIIERVKDEEPEKLVEFVNLKDDDGNTILHLLAAKAQHQVIELLFPEDQSQNVFKVNVNAINQRGSTALDVLHQNCGPLDRMRIKFLLDGAKRATDIPGSKSYEIKRSMWDLLFERKEGIKSETRDALMVVAILIATVTFQAQTNPPGGVWQEDGSITRKKFPCLSNQTEEVFYYAGQSVMAFNHPSTYKLFNIFNMVGFVASLILISLLVSGFTLRRKVSTLALTVTTWIALMSMFVTFGVSLSTLRANPNREHVPEASKDTAKEPATAPTSASTTFVASSEVAVFPLFIALMILLPLLVLLASWIKYIWMHLRKGITRSVKRGFKRLFCCPCFWKSSERDSEERTDMNA